MYLRLNQTLFQNLTVKHLDVYISYGSSLELRLRQLADLGLMGLGGTLLDPGALLDQDRRRRRLQDEREGFVGSAMEETKDNKKNIKIALKYYKISHTEKNPAITGIQRVSKEGKRVYIKNKDIRSVRNNFGLAIVSTSKGIMTGAESRKAGLGGEYICQVW